MQQEFKLTICQWLTAQPNIKEKTCLQNGGKTYRIFAYFCPKDVFNCNNNYMDYPTIMEMKEEEITANAMAWYCVNQKNKLIIELFFH